MCNTHDKVTGQKAVEMFATARILEDVCDTRMGYLKRQAMGFHTWLGEQDWCDNPDAYCQNIVTKVERMLDEDSEKWCEYLFKNDQVDPSKQMADEFIAYDESLELAAEIAERHSRSKAEKLKDMEERLERYIMELALHDQIQDFMDKLPAYKRPGQYRVVYQRIDALKDQGKLSYSGWFIFNNQLHSLIGRSALKAKYEIKALPDQILKLRADIAQLVKDIQERPEYFVDEHPEADEFIRLAAMV